ncbi:MAG: hypothetical protein IT320_11090 [Anaerolineae bacterium]|nr:hypothetical protein [Anaerolineae bacterium]
MRRILWLVVLILVILILIVLGLIVTGNIDTIRQVTGGRVVIPPTMIPAEAGFTVPTPADGREIAILTIHLESNAAGDVERAELSDARIVQGYAPNVFAQQGGDWKVELLGNESASFFALDPRRAELEIVGATEADNPTTYEVAPDIEWQLVVPLYRDGKPLDINGVRVLDAEGNTVFSTDIAFDEWRRIGQAPQ